jgi:hypothetical protein
MTDVLLPEKTALLVNDLVTQLKLVLKALDVELLLFDDCFRLVFLALQVQVFHCDQVLVIGNV